MPCLQGTLASIDPMVEELRKVRFGQLKLKDIECEIVHPYRVGELRSITVKYFGELNENEVPNGLGYVTYTHLNNRASTYSFRGIANFKNGVIEGKALFKAGDTQSCSIDEMKDGRPQGFGRSFFPDRQHVKLNSDNTTIAAGGYLWYIGDYKDAMFHGLGKFF